MARTRKAIKFELTSAFMAYAVIQSLYGLTPGKTFEEEFSIASFENILFEIIAFAFMFHEQIVEANAANSRPQSLQNLKQSMLNYVDGAPLVHINGSWQYDLTGITDVAERMVVKRCAILEPDGGGLVYKIGTENNGNIEPLPTDVYDRIVVDAKKKKVPGVPLSIINIPGDLIKTSLTVYVDPQIIDMQTGMLLNTTEEVNPVMDGIKQYLSDLEFNGNFVKDNFKQTIKSNPGIYLVKINSMQWKYADYPFVDFDEWKTPEAGYFKIQEEDLTITYLSDVLVKG